MEVEAISPYFYIVGNHQLIGYHVPAVLNQLRHQFTLQNKASNEDLRRQEFWWDLQ